MKTNKDLDRIFNNMTSKPTIFEYKVGRIIKKVFLKK